MSSGGTGAGAGKDLIIVRDGACFRWRGLEVPLAQFIRETMVEKLAEMKTPGRRKKMPLAWMVGLIRTNERDLAARVDEILYK